MAPAKQPRSKVFAIDTWITSIGSGSNVVALKIVKKRMRAFNMVLAYQRRSRIAHRITSSGSGSVAPDEKIHVDFDPSTGELKGPNGRKFLNRIGTIVSRNAPLNVGKWDDIPEEQIQSWIDVVLNKFDVDISKPYVKDRILYRMQSRFEFIQDKETRKARNPEIMELISKIASSNIGDQHSSSS